MIFAAFAAATLNATPPDAAVRPPVIPPYPAGVISYQLTYASAGATHPAKCAVSQLKVRPGYNRKRMARLICQQIVKANGEG